MERQECKTEILRLLQQNARMPETEIAERLDVSEESVSELIREMEESRTIIGYHAFVNEAYLHTEGVRAVIEVQIAPEREGGFDRLALSISKFPEVRSAYLVSGQYDLRVEVTGSTLEEVARFVSSKLATLEGVKSTATHFMLKKYKEAGFILQRDEEHERLKITP